MRDTSSTANTIDTANVNRIDISYLYVWAVLQCHPSFVRSRAAVRTPLYSSQITPEPIRDGPKLMYINLPVRVLVHPGDDPIDHLLRQIRP